MAIARGLKYLGTHVLILLARNARLGLGAENYFPRVFSCKINF
jgi:hypothetical protein